MAQEIRRQRYNFSVSDGRPETYLQNAARPAVKEEFIFNLKLKEMKKLNSKLYKDSLLDERMGEILGGTEGNASDQKYTDTKIDGGKWDIATEKLIDVEVTSLANDKPKKN